MTMGPREGRTLHAMSIDDAYEVQRVLSSGPGGRAEIVTIDGIGPYLRKKIPCRLSIVEYGSLCRNATIRVCPM